MIVKTGGDELPDRTFEEAGRLAAYYSKNRGSDKVEIDYVEKNMSKNRTVPSPVSSFITRIILSSLIPISVI